MNTLSYYLLWGQFLALFVLTPNPLNHRVSIALTIVYGDFLNFLFLTILGAIKFATSWETLIPLNLFLLLVLLWFHSLKSSYGGISLLTHPTVRNKAEQLRSGRLAFFSN
jgi:hypothetical protein